MKREICCLTVLLFAAGAKAQDAEVPPPPERVTPPVERPVPPPPPMAENGDAPDLPPPTVTITREDGKRVEKYSYGGVVYMVRVVPRNGAPYFLMDMDGDGILEKTDMTVEPNMKVPHWVIYEW